MYLLVSPFSSAMKVAPSILHKPTTKSDSLYFYKGKVLRLGSQGDAEVAQAVYYQRLCSAKTMLRRQINDAASQRLRGLKSTHNSLNNVWTPHQRVDMELAKKIWHLDIWEWRAKRISCGNSLSPSWRCELARLLGAPRQCHLTPRSECRLATPHASASLHVKVAE